MLLTRGTNIPALFPSADDPGPHAGRPFPQTRRPGILYRGGKRVVSSHRRVPEMRQQQQQQQLSRPGMTCRFVLRLLDSTGREAMVLKIIDLFSLSGPGKAGTFDGAEPSLKSHSGRCGRPQLFASLFDNTRSMFLVLLLGDPHLSQQLHVRKCNPLNVKRRWGRGHTW